MNGIRQAARQRRTGHPGPAGGFTLVEIILAMAIFAMVLVSIYESWIGIMKGTKSAQKAAAAVQRARVTVRAVEDALLTAQVYNGSPQHYWFVADTSGQFASLSMVARLPDSFPGSGMYGEQRLRHVSFTVESDDNWGRKLMLRQWPLLMPVGQGNAEAKPYEITLGREVDLFTLKFFDAVKKEWLDEWKQTNNFPKLVRVAIGMGNAPNVPESEREIITREIAPAAIMVPREYQMPPHAGAPNPMNPNQPGNPNMPVQPNNNPMVNPRMRGL